MTSASGNASVARRRRDSLWSMTMQELDRAAPLKLWADCAAATNVSQRSSVYVQMTTLAVMAVDVIARGGPRTTGARDANRDGPCTGSAGSPGHGVHAGEDRGGRHLKFRGRRRFVGFGGSCPPGVGPSPRCRLSPTSKAILYPCARAYVRTERWWNP